MNKKSVKWIKRIIKSLLIATASAVFILIIVMRYSEFQRKAREKEGLTILNSAYVYLKATDAEEEIFPRGPDPLENFYQSPNAHYKLYSQVETLPSDLIGKLPDHFKPFMNKKSYKIIVLTKDEDLGQYHCCTIDQDKVLQCGYF